MTLEELLTVVGNSGWTYLDIEYLATQESDCWSESVYRNQCENATNRHNLINEKHNTGLKHFVVPPVSNFRNELIFDLKENATLINDTAHVRTIDGRLFNMTFWKTQLVQF